MSIEERIARIERALLAMPLHTDEDDHGWTREECLFCGADVTHRPRHEPNCIIEVLIAERARG